MRAANWKRSPRLRRVLEVLSDGLTRTTWELQMAARTCAVGTCVSELRQNEDGWEIDCRRLAGGPPTWVYSMSGDEAARARAALAELDEREREGAPDA